MAPVTRLHRPLRPESRPLGGHRAALFVFALIATAGPLAFGAVDRIFQLGVLVLLFVGLLLRPPEIARVGRAAGLLLVVAVGLVLVSQFGATTWFGPVAWRTTLSGSYGVVFPWTRHPEPARALDGLLAGSIGLVWFAWVRTLASEHAMRPALIWSLFAAAAIMATVSFATQGIDPLAIYGIRYTPGWTGFGPFPNRNHSACLLAMGLVLGAGAVAWAASRRKTKAVFLGLAMLGVIFAALLATRSRGGLLVAGVGLLLFFGLTMLKYRDRRTTAFVLTAVLVLVALGLTFGVELLARFSSYESGTVSTLLRVKIWEDAVRMWRDAPLFGHGLSSFTQIFPFYQRVETGGAIVLHPESSWLQWIVELGALPVACGAFGLLCFCWPRIRPWFGAHSSFFLHAAGLAAAVTLGVHAFFDVPGHRWGTAGFALAALAVATAGTRDDMRRPVVRGAALVPLAVGVFWALPFLWDLPAWSPQSLQRLIVREQTTLRVQLPELERAAVNFPLSPAIHQAIGLHLLEAKERAHPSQWQQHFRIAARLLPGSWQVAADQARATARVSPGMSLHYWQMAIERAGHRADEVFRLAFDETTGQPGAESAWKQYAETNPALLLTYAQLVPESLGRAAFERWWEERGQTTDRLPEEEISTFYRLAAAWGRTAQVTQWAQLRPALLERDARTWVALLAGWKADAEAWKILASRWPEPAYPTAPPVRSREQLDETLRLEPDNFVNARELASWLAAQGEQSAAQTIVVTAARRPNAPEWFVFKAAYLLAAEGKIAEAVALVLAAPLPR